MIEKLTVDILNMPEALAFMRHEFAALARRIADHEEDFRVRTRLREIADGFEVGQSEDPNDPRVGY